MPGFVDNPYCWMRNCGVFVLSSAWEGFGNVLVEAMACGAPVVSTDCPSGPAEILEEGRWGRMVPVGDFNAMNVVMTEAILNARSQDIVDGRNYFDINKAATKYLSLLEGRYA